MAPKRSKVRAPARPCQPLVTTLQRGYLADFVGGFGPGKRESRPRADGFVKPVGIVKLGSTIVVADARQRAVFRVELVSGRAVMRLQLAGNIDRPDSLCAFDLDSVLVTTYDEQAKRGTLRRLPLDGRVITIASGAWEPRGIATDGERAFVAMRRGGQVMTFLVEPSDV